MLHIGGLRTALFSWAWARANSGRFVLRIEDTDRARIQEGARQYIEDALEWLGLDYDELIVQSERRSVYGDLVNKMIAEGACYWCECTPARLEELRQTQRQNKQPPGYDGLCRTKGLKDGAVARVKLPKDEKVTVDDIVYGKLEFDLNLMDDFVILKSDGMPTYHLAHLVDDNLSGVSHVIRGEEWVSSLPKHIVLHRFLGMDLPRYAHVPLILGKDRAKLSKRHGDFGALVYRDRGYEKDAVFNFLVLLGWSPKNDRELLTRDDVIRMFNLEGIQRHPAAFDEDKLNWLNKHYIRALPPATLADRITAEFDHPEATSAYLERLIPIVVERLTVVKDFGELFGFFFGDTVELDSALLTKRGGGSQLVIALERAAQTLEELEEFNAAAIEQTLRALAAELEVKAGDLFFGIRIAVTGRQVAPPLFETLELVGRERSVARIGSAVVLLDGSL